MIGDVVTITADNPYGVDEDYAVKGETGVIVDYDEDTNQFYVETGNSESTWWFTSDEFRPATEEECKARLRYLLMKVR